MHLFYQPEILQGHLSEEESKHAVRVLRMIPGEEFDLTDGKGCSIKARITEPDPRQCKFEVIQRILVPKRKFSIHLGIAPTKNMDRMEWLVEKSIEVGIEKISFLHCKTSERTSINLERIEKIAISAMKQSQQAWLPSLSNIIPFGTFIRNLTEDQKFIAMADRETPKHLKEVASPCSSYVILIGPEGDFSKEEVASALTAGFQPVSLGPNRLRTETAGLSSVTILNIINQ